MTVFGRIHLSKGHLLCPRGVSFKITVYLQTLICFLGQHTVFESASEILDQILGLDLSAKQIQRVSEWYGRQIDPIVEANQVEYIPQLANLGNENENTYVMVDGSMLFTREDGWKEMKLARFFNERQNVDIQRNRKEIVDSIYVSHLGPKDKFFTKLERHLTLVKNPKVFVCDGAKYIWNWVEDNYPGAVQILDYYHAIEKIAEFARRQFREESERKDWLEDNKKLLLDDGVEQVISKLKKLKSKNTQASEAKDIAIRYYVEHADRMMYKTFKNQGLLIGSGPIEAGHRNVIQQRLKLSGQKWSIKGANAIANLRCLNKSNAWTIIEDLARLAA